MFSLKRGEVPVPVRIELNEDKVPYLDAKMRVAIDQFSLTVPVYGQVQMEFRTWSTGTRLSHHPKVVLLSSRNHMN